MDNRSVKVLFKPVAMKDHPFFTTLTSPMSFERNMKVKESIDYKCKALMNETINAPFLRIDSSNNTLTSMKSKIK